MSLRLQLSEDFGGGELRGQEQVARTGAQRRLRGGMAAEALAQLDAALHHAQQVLPGPELAKPRLSQPSL